MGKAGSSVAVGSSFSSSPSSSPPHAAPRYARKCIYNTVCGGVEITDANGSTSLQTKLRNVFREPSSSSSSFSSTNALAATTIMRGSASFAAAAHTSEGQSTWEQHRLPLETFEGNAKDQWIDATRGWCYLCQEPVGVSAGTHIGDRDHVNMAVFLFLFTLYPRTWSPRDILRDGLARFPGLVQHCTGVPTSQDHLHTLDDTARRAELEAQLEHLCNPPHQAISHSLFGRTPLALWVSGERNFKVNVTRLVATAVPPMSNGVHTAFTQKIWSRTNLERMYDAVNIARIKIAHGVEPKTARLDKAFFMRTMLWELMAALDCKDLDPVTELLVDDTLRKISRELMHLQSMQYMNRAQDLATKMNFPTWGDLRELNSL